MRSRLDYVLGGVVVSLLLVIGFFLSMGDVSTLRILSFNLDGKTVHPNGLQMIFQFNRPVDKKSIELGFAVEPKLEGKFGWNGNRMSFSPTEALTYGTNYSVVFNEGFSEDGNIKLSPFSAHFSTSTERIAYIDTEAGMRRLSLFDLHSHERKIVTPDDLIVYEFKPDPLGEKIYFFATPKSFLVADYPPEQFQQLYDVDLETNVIRLHADNKLYVNQFFDISPDGKTLALNRVKVDRTGVFEESGLWVKSVSGNHWKKFWYTEYQSGPFLFSPNPDFIVLQGMDGFVLVPMMESAVTPQFLGNFSDVSDFSSGRAQISFLELPENDIFSQKTHIAILKTGGVQERIFEDRGLVSNVRFGDGGSKIYFLFKNTSDPKPFDPVNILGYDFDSRSEFSVTHSVDYTDVSFDISQDGTTIVLDRRLILENGNVPASGRSELWLYDETSSDLESMGVFGENPRFLY